MLALVRGWMYSVKYLWDILSAPRHRGRLKETCIAPVFHMMALIINTKLLIFALSCVCSVCDSSASLRVIVNVSIWLIEELYLYWFCDVILSFFIYCTSSECGDAVDRSRSRAETSALEHYHSPSIDDGMYFKATFCCCCLQHTWLVDL